MWHIVAWAVRVAGALSGLVLSISLPVSAQNAAVQIDDALRLPDPDSSAETRTSSTVTPEGRRAATLVAAAPIIPHTPSSRARTGQQHMDATPAEKPSARLPVVGDALIARAVAAELASTGKRPSSGIALTEFRADAYERFAQKFTEAKVPDCLHGDALKRQPPVILFVRFEGVYAVPFVVLAKLRGKCL